MKKILSFFCVVTMLLSFSTGAMADSNENCVQQNYRKEFRDDINEHKQIPHEDLKAAYQNGACTKQTKEHYDTNGNVDYSEDIYTSPFDNGNNTGSVSQIALITFAKSTDSDNESKNTPDFKSKSLTLLPCASSVKDEDDHSEGVECYNLINYIKIADSNHSGYSLYKLTSCSITWINEDSTLQVYNKIIYYGNKDVYGGSAGSESVTGTKYSKTFSYTNYVGDVPIACGACGVNAYCRVRRIASTASYWDFDVLNALVTANMSVF
jgi:hypothetical protein